MTALEERADRYLRAVEELEAAQEKYRELSNSLKREMLDAGVNAIRYRIALFRKPDPTPHFTWKRMLEVLEEMVGEQEDANTANDIRTVLQRFMERSAKVAVVKEPHCALRRINGTLYGGGQLRQV